jgi:hypothetical protein
MQIRETGFKDQSSPRTVTTQLLPYRSPVLVEYGQVSKLTQGGPSIGIDGINTTMMGCI